MYITVAMQPTDSCKLRNRQLALLRKLGCLRRD